MSYQGRDPNQYPNSDPYSGYSPPPSQPTDPYSGQQYSGQQGGGYQPGGYQQPNYGQPPYGQQQYYNPNAGTTSMGMSQNTASGLSYVLGWITGLIFFLVEKQNREVRFHAIQSLIYFGALSIIDIVIGFVHLGIISYLLNCLLGLLILGSWIALMIMGFQGRHFKIPVIGDYAERYANQL